VDKDLGVALVSIASTLSDTDTPGENAIGFIDDVQIDSTRKFLRELPSSVRTVFITLHHPLFGRHPLKDSIWGELVEMTEMSGRAARLLLNQPMSLWKKVYDSQYFTERFLANQGRQAVRFLKTIKESLAGRPIELVVLFGHRHERSLRRVGDVVFEEAPNVATEHKNDFGFYALDRNATSQLEVHWCPMTPEHSNQ
jgi:hypothetical protein